MIASDLLQPIAAALAAQNGRNAPSCFKSPLNTEDRAATYNNKNAAQRAGPVPRIDEKQSSTRPRVTMAPSVTPRRATHHAPLVIHLHSIERTKYDVQRLEAQVVRPRIEQTQPWPHAVLHATEEKPANRGPSGTSST